MYNESSTALKILLKKSKTVIQLAPPHTHIKNVPERAIRTFENHFVVGLALVENNVLIYLWCFYSEASRNHNKSLAKFTDKPNIIGVHITIRGI